MDGTQTTISTPGSNFNMFKVLYILKLAILIWVTRKGRTYKRIFIKPRIRWYDVQIKLRLQVNLMLVGKANDKASQENRA